MLDKDYRPQQPARLPLKEFAFRRLRDAVIHCEFEPGSFVSESRLADLFGLGKASVRSALARLSSCGLATPCGRRGWQIAPVTTRTIGHVIDLRARLEPALAQTVATDEIIAELRGLAGIGGAASGRDARASDMLFHYDRSFMDRLAAARGDAILQRWLAELWDRSAQICTILARTAPEAPVPADRARLVDALQSGDRNAAEALLRGGVESFERWVLRCLLEAPAILESRPVSAPRAAPRAHTIIAKGDGQRPVIQQRGVKT